MAKTLITDHLRPNLPQHIHPSPWQHLQTTVGLPSCSFCFTTRSNYESTRDLPTAWVVLGLVKKHLPQVIKTHVLSTLCSLRPTSPGLASFFQLKPAMGCQRWLGVAPGSISRRNLDWARSNASFNTRMSIHHIIRGHNRMPNVPPKLWAGALWCVFRRY